MNAIDPVLIATREDFVERRNEVWRENEALRERLGKVAIFLGCAQQAMARGDPKTVANYLRMAEQAATGRGS